jgi:hypothetical protein
MRKRLTTLVISCVVVVCLFVPSAVAQVIRDSTAARTLANSVIRMGGLAPQDSTATATMSVGSGTSIATGSMKFSTRGLNQTAEDITLPVGSQSLIFSLGASNDKRPGAKPGEDSSSFELSLTAQSPLFPLPWLVDKLNNADIAIQNVGNEVLNGNPSTHVRLTNTFNSNPNLKHYASFTTTDLWLDAKTGLPSKISYERRTAGGPEPTIPISYEFSDYRNVQGVLYPFQVRKIVNGTVSGVITVQSVQINSGVADAVFAVR